MSIIGGLDVHRGQITFDWVDADSGEARRGRIMPATRARLGEWLAGLPGAGGAFAVEACTGWRFVVEELQRAGLAAHLAEPADTASLRGRKRRAKTDRADARLLRELLTQGRLPTAWIGPGWILDLRTTVRLRKTLVDQRTAWQQRIHAVLFHHGLPRPSAELLCAPTRSWLEQVTLPPASRQLLCRALQRIHFGIGAVTAPTILAELGDARRFPSGDQVVRYAGLDVTVYASDDKVVRPRCARALQLDPGYGHATWPPTPSRQHPTHQRADRDALDHRAPH